MIKMVQTARSNFKKMYDDDEYLIIIGYNEHFNNK